MEEPDKGGKRKPVPSNRDATTSQTARAPAPAPRPKPVAKPKQATGVPMAGQSYAKRQADEARRAKGIEPAPAPRPRPQPPTVDDDLDLEEDFDLDEEYEDEPETNMAHIPETSSQMYSTRRALAEQVNQDVGVRPDHETDTSGMAALRERREAWKKMVKKKEEQGQSPYVMRWAKVSFFPLLYFIVSLSLLRKIRYEYAEYYDYDPFYIVLGLMVGTIFLVIAATGTMLRAKRVRKPILLKGKATWMGLLVFIGISIYLALTFGLAYAWLFSIGFLAAGLLIVAIGFALERSGKGVFWVKDPVEGSDKRWLEFVPVTEA
ncbi:MAG: hypothetical protein JSW25_01020 [Thermoplasmata archaeon]|nr:MAG: hypothetical protein JSW25_01020 [Thermoplasmata archaeon]